MQTSDLDNISLRIQSGYAVITLKAKPVNALSESLLENFLDLLSRVDANEQVGLLIIRSELAVFSAGGDATWMARQIAERGTDGLVDEFERLMGRFRTLCLKLRSARYITIAEIKGHALAGGLELAAACDMRVAADSDDIRIGVPEMAHFGVAPSGGGGVYYLTRLLGVANTMNLVLYGQPITPRKAQAIGLVQELFPLDELERANERGVATMAEKSGPLALRLIKKMLYQSEPASDLASQIELDRSVHWTVMREGNFKSNVTAFAEKFRSRR